MSLCCCRPCRQEGFRLRGIVSNRISGRSSHVAKLRSEFDAGGYLSHTLFRAALININAGGDYDLTEVEPGDLDPHAVSSIFKTFLREREC